MWTLANVNTGELVFIVGGTIAVFAIFMGTIRRIIKTKAREQSRREIAAYIAEGSMSPEQGERLMKANPDDEGSGCC
jgi:hypothetical protein